MEVIDITLLGSGIAATLTLIEVLNKLVENPTASQKITITVIEKNGEFWKGVPYGARSSVNALTITTVDEFIYETEKPAFFNWLKANKDDWAAYYRKHGGITAARWLENNLPLVDNNEWHIVYIPRFIFGIYLHQKIHTLLKIVEEKQLAIIKLIQAEAIDIQSLDNNYEIIIEHPGTEIAKIVSHKVVIATGAAPVKKICAVTTRNSLYINDIYEHSVADNINEIHAVLSMDSNPQDRNVLIVGSNASSIELLYLLEGLPETRKLINKTVVISTSGLLPYHISTEELTDHPVPNLDKLKADGNYTLKTLVSAAGEDLKLAVRYGAHIGYIATVISVTLKLMQPLGEDAHKEFFAIHGINLRNMFRRSGPEYKSGSQALIEAAEAILLKGRFLNVQPSPAGLTLNYLDPETTQPQIYPLSFKVVVNCTGSDDLNQCSSRLIHNLVNRHHYKMNLSRKGLEVNEKFEIATNLYVMGPLLGGNMNKLIHFWHLENAARLSYLAPHLADELLKK